MAYGINKPSAIEWCSQDNLMLLGGWARDGWSITDIAIRIGISPSTLTNWANKYPEIRDALKHNTEVVNFKVENALLKAALGYVTKEEKITTVIRKGAVVETIKEVTQKEIAPSVPACQFWLINKKGDKWQSTKNRNSILQDVAGSDDAEIKIEITRAQHGADNETKVTAGLEGVNTGIKIRKKTEQDYEEERKLKKQAELDYWPDDWDEEDEED